MPEHKLNLNPAEELVQIDDTGPEVDVEIDEDQNANFEAQPVKENILEAMPEEKVEEKVEDEHEEYSKSVKKRINKLTAKLREAERREEAATKYAQNVHKENATLKQQKENIDGNYILSEANRITAETEATKTLLQKRTKNKT